MCVVKKLRSHGAYPLTVTFGTWLFSHEFNIGRVGYGVSDTAIVHCRHEPQTQDLNDNYHVWQNYQFWSVIYLLNVEFLYMWAKNVHAQWLNYLVCTLFWPRLYTCTLYTVYAGTCNWINFHLTWFDLILILFIATARAGANYSYRY